MVCCDHVHIQCAVRAKMGSLVRCYHTVDTSTAHTQCTRIVAALSRLVTFERRHHPYACVNEGSATRYSLCQAFLQTLSFPERKVSCYWSHSVTMIAATLAALLAFKRRHRPSLRGGERASPPGAPCASAFSKFCFCTARRESGTAAM